MKIYQGRRGTLAFYRKRKLKKLKKYEEKRADRRGGLGREVAWRECISGGKARANSEANEGRGRRMEFWEVAR